jgi:hypothetical protein
VYPDQARLETWLTHAMPFIVSRTDASGHAGAERHEFGHFDGARLRTNSRFQFGDCHDKVPRTAGMFQPCDASGLIIPLHPSGANPCRIFPSRSVVFLRSGNVSESQWHVTLYLSPIQPIHYNFRFCSRLCERRKRLIIALPTTRCNE